MTHGRVFPPISTSIHKTIHTSRQENIRACEACYIPNPRLAHDSTSARIDQYQSISISLLGRDTTQTPPIYWFQHYRPHQVTAGSSPSRPPRVLRLQCTCSRTQLVPSGNRQLDPLVFRSNSLLPARKPFKIAMRPFTREFLE